MEAAGGENLLVISSWPLDGALPGMVTPEDRTQTHLPNPPTSHLSFQQSKAKTTTEPGF